MATIIGQDIFYPSPFRQSFRQLIKCDFLLITGNRMFGPFSNMDLKFKSFKVASLGPSGWPHARSNKYIQVKVWGDAAVGL